MWLKAAHNRRNTARITYQLLRHCLRNVLRISSSERKCGPFFSSQTSFSSSSLLRCDWLLLYFSALSNSSTERAATPLRASYDYSVDMVQTVYTLHCLNHTMTKNVKAHFLSLFTRRKEYHPPPSHMQLRKTTVQIDWTSQCKCSRKV